MPSPLFLLLAGIAFLATLGGLYYKVHHDGYEQGSAEVTSEWRAANEAAEKQSRIQETKDKQAKEKADAENSATTARLTDDIRRLRESSDKRRPAIVPAAPAGSKCPPDQACFDRAGLESALRDYRTEIRGLADEAAKVEIDLNTARKWAQGR